MGRPINVNEKFAILDLPNVQKHGIMIEPDIEIIRKKLIHAVIGLSRQEKKELLQFVERRQHARRIY